MLLLTTTKEYLPKRNNQSPAGQCQTCAAPTVEYMESVTFTDETLVQEREVLLRECTACGRIFVNHADVTKGLCVG